jgi:hypothetical protein
MTNHLKGPWRAVLSDDHGYVYPSVERAIEECGEEEWAEISIRRASALPTPEDDDPEAVLRLPGSYAAGDCIFELNLYFGDDGDRSTGCFVRYEQAKAMAAGLNAAGGAS